MIIKKIKKDKLFLGAIMVAMFLLCFFQLASLYPRVFAQEASSGDGVDQDGVDEKENKIDDLQNELEKAKKAKEENVQKKLIISNDVQKINGNISFIESEISKSQSELRSLEVGIVEKEKGIARQKEFISDILRNINQVDQEVGLISINSNSGIEDYFAAADSLEQLQEKLVGAVNEMKAQKADLDQKREEQVGVVEMQDDQRKTLVSEKNKKNVLLGQTQLEIKQKESEIGEIQSKISKLKADISRLLGKGYDAKDIEDAAKFASKASGVRKDFLMGMLVIESDLGRYTGGCDYKESRMSSYRKEIFKDICEELDYDYKKQKVSCPPSGYSGTGGAMGVAQFMSDTWMGYKSSIATATGHNPPDPWNLTDGVTAMALKLAKGGATSNKGECNAAKLYLSGTTSSKYDWYCDKVLYWADNYEALIGG
jgi:peptidoglycan hydrolase CwlO-like protein